MWNGDPPTHTAFASVEGDSIPVYIMFPAMEETPCTYLQLLDGRVIFKRVRAQDSCPRNLVLKEDVRDTAPQRTFISNAEGSPSLLT